MVLIPFFDSLGDAAIDDIFKLNIKLIITIHTTPCSCMGNTISCEEPKSIGEFNNQSCTANRLIRGGLPLPLANLISIQDGFPFSLENKNILSRLITSRQITEKLHTNYKNYLKMANKIHVCANWVKESLQKQGFSENQVCCIKAGMQEEKKRHTRKLMEDGVLKIIYFGRCSEIGRAHV